MKFINFNFISYHIFKYFNKSNWSPFLKAWYGSDAFLTPFSRLFGQPDIKAHITTSYRWIRFSSRNNYLRTLYNYQWHINNRVTV